MQTSTDKILSSQDQTKKMTLYLQLIQVWIRPISYNFQISEYYPQVSQYLFSKIRNYVQVLEIKLLCQISILIPKMLNIK